MPLQNWFSKSTSHFASRVCRHAPQLNYFPRWVRACKYFRFFFFVFRLHATASSLVNCFSGYFLAFQHSTLNIINVSHQTLKLGLDFEFSFMDLFFNESLKYDYLFVINYKLILCLHRWQAYPWQPPDFQADIR